MTDVRTSKANGVPDILRNIVREGGAWISAGIIGEAANLLDDADTLLGRLAECFGDDETEFADIKLMRDRIAAVDTRARHDATDQSAHAYAGYGETPSASKQCDIEFSSEGESYRCTFKSGHAGQHGQIEVLRKPVDDFTLLPYGGMRMGNNGQYVYGMDLDAALKEIAHLQDSCDESEANLTIAERQVTEARMEFDRHSSETYDQRWIREAKGTLDKLYAFLQAKNVPHAVDTREWIDNALKVLNAYEPPAPKANEQRELTLHDFGYAPGNYSIKCLDCGQEALWCDKRASRCETCAKQALAENRKGLSESENPQS